MWVSDIWDVGTGISISLILFIVLIWLGYKIIVHPNISLLDKTKRLVPTILSMIFWFIETPLRILTLDLICIFIEIIVICYVAIFTPPVESGKIEEEKQLLELERKLAIEKAKKERLEMRMKYLELKVKHENEEDEVCTDACKVKDINTCEDLRDYCFCYFCGERICAYKVPQNQKNCPDCGEEISCPVCEEIVCICPDDEPDD